MKTALVNDFKLNSDIGQKKFVLSKSLDIQQIQNIYYSFPTLILFNYYKEVIYIGKSDQNIKKCLIDHLSGLKGRHTRSAFYFSTDIDFNPAKTAEEILLEYYKFFGKLPECNEISLSFH